MNEPLPTAPDPSRAVLELTAQASSSGGADMLVWIVLGAVVVLGLLAYVLSRRRQKAEEEVEGREGESVRPREKERGERPSISPQEYEERKDAMSLAEIKVAKQADVGGDLSKEELRQLREQRRAATQTRRAREGREGEAAGGADAAGEGGEAGEASASEGVAATGEVEGGAPPGVEADAGERVEASPEAAAPADAPASEAGGEAAATGPVEDAAAKQPAQVEEPSRDPDVLDFGLGASGGARPAAARAGIPSLGSGLIDVNGMKTKGASTAVGDALELLGSLPPSGPSADAGSAGSASAEAAAQASAVAEEAARAAQAAAAAASDAAARAAQDAQESEAAERAAEAAAAEAAQAAARATEAAAQATKPEQPPVPEPGAGSERAAGSGKVSAAEKGGKGEKGREKAAEGRKRPSAAAERAAGKPKSLRDGLSETRNRGFVARLGQVFGGKLDDAVVEELEAVLFTADIGVQTSRELLGKVERSLGRKELKDGAKALEFLREEIFRILKVCQAPLAIGKQRPFVVLVVGVNGAGKTTTIGKLAAKLSEEGQRVLLVAGDTFRAAAIEQLEEWGERTGCKVHKGAQGSDPSSVIFDGLKIAEKEGFDVVLADTAGRLHNKKDLVDELKKITRVAGKAVRGAPHHTVLVLDATNGQNALQQAKEFREAVDYNGIIMTKLDGTAKGGVIIGICDELKVPVHYIGIGEMIDDLRRFQAEEFVEALFS